MANEKRLIDANALYIELGKLAREPDYQHEGENWSTGVAMSMGEVWSAPTVDAVEVVYCDNCVNHNDCWVEDTFRAAWIDKPYCCVGKWKTNSSYGERKDNEKAME